MGHRRFAFGTGLGVGACATLVCSIAGAQVNVERLRKGLEGNGASGSIEASFVGRTGNIEGITAGGAGLVEGVHGPHWGMVNASSDYARSNRNTTINRTFAHARYALRLLSWLQAETFVQEQRDAFRNLRFRSVVGMGPRFGLVQERWTDLFIGTAYMLEWERIDVQPGAPDAETTWAHRWSNYLSVTILQDKHYTASSTTYLQPRFDKVRDIRVLHETALVVDLGALLATKVSVSVRRDSDPPTGVKSTDVEVKNSIVMKF